MGKGEFDNLPLAGKPLPNRVEYNPYADFTTNKMNQILVQEGFAPEWVTKQKDIRCRISTSKVASTSQLRLILSPKTCVHTAYTVPTARLGW